MSIDKRVIDELLREFRAPSLLVASIVVAPVVIGEELVWRGVVLGTLARRIALASVEAPISPERREWGMRRKYDQETKERVDDEERQRFVNERPQVRPASTARSPQT